jgi:RAT1-interacting protein
VHLGSKAQLKNCSSTELVQEIASFSFDENHSFRLDDSSLSYYYTPKLGADLSEGFDSFRQLDDSTDDHLNALVKTISALEERQGELCKTDIVTWRGMMTKVIRYYIYLAVG